MLAGLGKRVREAVVVVVMVAVGIRLASWLLAPLWPVMVVFAAIVAIYTFAIRNR